MEKDVCEGFDVVTIGLIFFFLKIWKTDPNKRQMEIDIKSLEGWLLKKKAT